MDSLWPDFQDMPVKVTPRTILNQQAEALGDQFSNQIVGLVRTRQAGHEFVNAFVLRCPSLSYTYELFRIRYGMIEIYPVLFSLEGDIAQELTGAEETEGVLKADNEDDFIETLRRIFSANKTRGVIRALRQHLEE